MIHLKSNFINFYKHDMPTIQKEQDMEEQLFGKCEKLKDLYIKCSIMGYEEVFNNNITVERLKQIVKFIQELNLKNNYKYIYIYINANTYIHGHMDIYVCA